MHTHIGRQRETDRTTALKLNSNREMGRHAETEPMIERGADGDRNSERKMSRWAERDRTCLKQQHRDRQTGRDKQNHSLKQ